jgi:transposase
MAYLRGEPKVWSVVRVPSVAEARTTVGSIVSMAGWLTNVSNTSTGSRDCSRSMASMTTNHCVAIGCSDAAAGTIAHCWWPSFAVATQGGDPARTAAAGACHRNDQDDCIGQTETERSSAKKIRDLTKIKSIGPEFATALVGELFCRSFDNRKQLASYVGLTPAHFQSGETCRDQGISKAGNAKARTVMIELAWLWLRHQPASPLSAWFQESCWQPQEPYPADCDRRR